MKPTNNELITYTGKTLDSIAEIKFYIHRYLETKNEHCIRMAKEEVQVAKRMAIKVLEDEVEDTNENRRKDAEETFLPLLETLDGLERFLVDEFEGKDQ